MRETRLSGSEGGGVANIRSPYPYLTVHRFAVGTGPGLVGLGFAGPRVGP
jgi:hypothetical protein